MILFGTIIIDKIRWVRQEKKTISILVENGGQEIDLSIKREQLENLKGMVEQCLKGEAKPGGEEDGSFRVYVMAENEKVSLDLVRDDVLPFPSTLIMKDTKGREFHLSFDASQAKMMREKLEMFIHVDDELSKIKDTLSLNDPVS